MLGKNILHKIFTSFTLLTLMCVYTAVSIAAPGDTGEITASGNVTVNGQSVVSNSTIVSGSTIVTAPSSKAVISLGSKGKVELLPETSVTLKFSDNSIVTMITSGKVRVMNTSGISSTVTTNSATVVGDTGQANSFAVDVGCGDTAKCAQTFVETVAGLVTLRSGNSVKQVAAGTDASSGSPSQTGCKPCYRPGSAPPTPTAGVGSGALAAILIAAGGVGVAAFLLSRENNVTTEGNGIVVSPIVPPFP